MILYAFYKEFWPKPSRALLQWLWRCRDRRPGPPKSPATVRVTTWAGARLLSALRRVWRALDAVEAPCTGPTCHSPSRAPNNVT